MPARNMLASKQRQATGIRGSSHTVGPVGAPFLGAHRQPCCKVNCDPKNIEHLDKDEDLVVLRGRDDCTAFQLLAFRASVGSTYALRPKSSAC